MSRRRITYVGGVNENAVFLFRYGLLLERKGERDTIGSRKSTAS
jgi:hypothetical protein